MCVGERETQPHWCYFPSSTLAGLLLGLTNKAYLWMTRAASMCATLSKSPAWPTPNHPQLGHSLFQQEQLSAHSLSLDQPPNRERRGKGGKRSVVFMVYTACPCSLPAPVRGERRGLGMQGGGSMALFCSRPFFSGEFFRMGMEKGPDHWRHWLLFSVPHGVPWKAGEPDQHSPHVLGTRSAVPDLRSAGHLAGQLLGERLGVSRRRCILEGHPLTFLFLDPRTCEISSSGPFKGIEQCCLQKLLKHAQLSPSHVYPRPQETQAHILPPSNLLHPVSPPENSTRHGQVIYSS